MWHNSNPVPWMDILKDKDVHEVSTVYSLDHRHSYCYSLVIASKNIIIWKINLFLSGDDIPKHSQKMLNYHFLFFCSVFLIDASSHNQFRLDTDCIIH